MLIHNIPLACGKTRSSSPLLEYFKTLELQYPSAMKMSPVEATATEVGWHRVLYPLPFSNLFPKVNDGLNAPGENCFIYITVILLDVSSWRSIGSNALKTIIVIRLWRVVFFFYLKHLVHGHICDPYVPLVIYCDAVGHVEKTCSPTG